MAAARVVVHERAYAIIVLHAYKYPHLAVNGVLLGSPAADEGHGADAASGDPHAAETGHASRRMVHVRSAIPLGHGQLNLTPMLDVALLQVLAPRGATLVRPS